MKTPHLKKYKFEPKSPNPTPNHQTSNQALEQVADELTQLAHGRLPAGVLKGALSGHEDDIRQEAILLALTWYLKGGSPDPDEPVEAWHAPRAIAGALRIIKRDALKAILGETAQQQKHHDQPKWFLHPVMIRSSGWPSDVMRDLCKRAIRIALQEGAISPTNAAIAEAVYVHGDQVSDLAKRLRVHRSNIYQHLTRSRPHIQAAIKHIEVSLERISTNSCLKQ